MITQIHKKLTIWGNHAHVNSQRNVRAALRGTKETKSGLPELSVQRVREPLYGPPPVKTRGLPRTQCPHMSVFSEPEAVSLFPRGGNHHRGDLESCFSPVSHTLLRCSRNLRSSAIRLPHPAKGLNHWPQQGSERRYMKQLHWTLMSHRGAQTPKKK